MNTLGQSSRFDQGLVVMEKVLLLRSYLVGHALSIADIAVYAALRGMVLLNSIVTIVMVTR